MDDKLHSAGLIEEAFDDELLLGRDDAERFVPRGKIAGQLACASFRQTREIQWPLVQTRFVAFGVGRRKLLPFPLTPALSLGEREHGAASCRCPRPFPVTLRGRWLTLSPRERAGVRGKRVSDLRRGFGWAMVTVRIPYVT